MTECVAFRANLYFSDRSGNSYSTKRKLKLHQKKRFSRPDGREFPDSSSKSISQLLPGGPANGLLKPDLLGRGGAWEDASANWDTCRSRRASGSPPSCTVEISPSHSACAVLPWDSPETLEKLEVIFSWSHWCLNTRIVFLPRSGPDRNCQGTLLASVWGERCWGSWSAWWQSGWKGVDPRLYQPRLWSATQSHHPWVSRWHPLLGFLWGFFWLGEHSVLQFAFEVIGLAMQNYTRS